MKDVDTRLIHSAFSPAQEIVDPRQFVGRESEIRKAINALLNAGSFLAIFGLRGVGKSSVGHQIKLIAEGDSTLPQALGIERLLPKKNFNYIVHYYKSDGFVENVADLFKRILFGDDDNPSLFSLTKSGDRRLQEFKRTVGVEGGASFFGSKVGAKGSEESKFVPYISDDLIQQFRALLGTVRKDNQERDGLLIIVDEFDTIPDKTGFASIVKACSSEYVKFGVIGIGSNVAELIRDHSSINRQIDFIDVPLMPEEERADIIRRAEFRLGNAITFDEEATAEICRRSEGFPYFVHLLGKEAVLLAFERGSSKVMMQDIETLSKNIAEGRLTNIFENVYHESVKNSPQRELLLKLFAEEKSNEISSEPVYANAKDMGITNPSQLMKQLTSPDNSMTTPVLVKVREKYFRFSDPVFKVYARIRNWKHEG